MVSKNKNLSVQYFALFSPREIKVGDVLRFKVVAQNKGTDDIWRFTVEDVTPLPGAEPIGYGCQFCGRIDEAKEDGSLPDGWKKVTYKEGERFACPDCTDVAFCRVCGCSENDACETGEGPCSWVEPDLCSACVGKE